MIDTREQVATELAERVFERLFARPRGWDDAQADAHVAACVEAVRPMLPRDRADALGLTGRAAQRLKSESRTNAWPTVREVCEAIREEQRSASVGRAEDWPHRHSELVIETAARWVTNFREWPRWLEHPQRVAEELMARGLVTEAQLADAGYGPAIDRRVAMDRERIEELRARVDASFPSKRESAA